MNTLSAEQRIRLYENMKSCSSCRFIRNRSRATRRRLEVIEYRRFMQDEGTSVDPWRHGRPEPVRPRCLEKDEEDEETLCTEDEKEDEEEEEDSDFE